MPLLHRRGLLGGVALGSALLLAGCGSQPVIDKPISPVDGVALDVYVFTGEGPAQKHHVTDRSQVGQVVDYLVRSKGPQSKGPDKGATYEAYVITLHDGSKLEALHAYLNPKTNYIWTEKTGWVDVQYGGALVDESGYVQPTSPGTPVPLEQVPMAKHRTTS